MAEKLIEFKGSDFLNSDEQHLRRKAWDIAKCVSDDLTLIDVLSDFLLLFQNTGDFEKRFEEWKSKLSLVSGTYNNDNLEALLNKLSNSYKKIKSQAHIGKLRGLIFEQLIENHYSEVYKPYPAKFSKGCQVIIKGKKVEYICPEDREKNRKTVDIAGHKKDIAEFYELKVGPDGFDEHVISYLKILNDNLMENKVSNRILVGGMTLKKKASLEMKLSGLSVDSTFMVLYGIDELKNIL